MKDLNPEIWLPHFWFFMYSCAHNYPEYPNKVTKRKYYDFISNLPLFCPNEEIQKKIINYLDVFPVTAYLDTKDSFTYWVHFIHNKMNKDLGNEEQTYYKHLDEYYANYLPKSYKLSEKIGVQKKHIVIVILFILFGFIIYHTK
jgi:hypothetical protein